MWGDHVFETCRRTGLDHASAVTDPRRPGGGRIHPGCSRAGTGSAIGDLISLARRNGFLTSEVITAIASIGLPPPGTEVWLKGLLDEPYLNADDRKKVNAILKEMRNR